MRCPSFIETQPRLCQCRFRLPPQQIQQARRSELPVHRIHHDDPSQANPAKRLGAPEDSSSRPTELESILLKSCKATMSIPTQLLQEIHPLQQMQPASTTITSFSTSMPTPSIRESSEDADSTAPPMIRIQ